MLGKNLILDFPNIICNRKDLKKKRYDSFKNIDEPCANIASLSIFIVELLFSLVRHLVVLLGNMASTLAQLKALTQKTNYEYSIFMIGS